MSPSNDGLLRTGLRITDIAAAHGFAHPGRGSLYARAWSRRVNAQQRHGNLPLGCSYTRSSGELARRLVEMGAHADGVGAPPAAGLSPRASVALLRS